MSERIGYLIPSGDFFVVHCHDCATNIETPVYRENVAGYRQTCKACGRLLAGPADADWPELFNGQRRTPIVPDEPAQPAQHRSRPGPKQPPRPLTIRPQT
jgi:ribosomal protein S27E